MKGLVAVAGPTSVGKSQLALRLAIDFDGEIISADSRQVYRHMDIGTAKPSRNDQSLVGHHLIDVIDPDQTFSLAVYQRLSDEAIEKVRRRGKLPVLVGGSGLYVWSVLEGWRIPEVPPDGEFRRSLEARASMKGSCALYGELQEVDPVAAARIMPSNMRRIIRALEIYRALGRPASQVWEKRALSFPVLIIGLTTSREDLYLGIDGRVDDMMRMGLVDEVKALMARGYSFSLPSMSGIGYRQIGMFLQGKLDLHSAIQQIKYETHRFARRQYAWFHLDDSRINWFDVRAATQGVNELVRSFVDRIEANGENDEIH